MLGMNLTHSEPGRPMGRGKIERVFETIQQQFLAEVTGDERTRPGTRSRPWRPDGLLEAWGRTVYHPRVHAETGQSPQERLDAAGPQLLPDPALLRHAFTWSAIRLVRKTATVAVEGNVYPVDPFLAGRKVELVFDPFDMTELDRLLAGPQGRPRGPAGHRPARPPQGPARRGPRRADPTASTTSSSSPTPTPPPWPSSSACPPSTTPTTRRAPRPAAGPATSRRNNERRDPPAARWPAAPDAAAGMCADIAADLLIAGTATSCTTPRSGASSPPGPPSPTGSRSPSSAGTPPSRPGGRAAALLRLRAGRPAHRRQPRRARHPRQPPGEPRQPRPRNIALVTDAITAANG